MFKLRKNQFVCITYWEGGANMADSQQHSPVQGLIADLCGAVQHLLLNAVNRTRADVVGEMIDDIDDSEIYEARESIFKIAKSVLQARTGVAAEIEIKKRKGNNALIASAGDVFDMFLYINDEQCNFPKDVLKQSGKLIDIDLDITVQRNDSRQDVIEDVISSDTVDEKIILLMQTVRDQKNQIETLRDELHKEREVRETEMKYWVTKLHVLLEELQKHDYVTIVEKGQKPDVIYEVSCKDRAPNTSNHGRKNADKQPIMTSVNAKSPEHGATSRNVPTRSAEKVDQQTADQHREIARDARPPPPATPAASGQQAVSPTPRPADSQADWPQLPPGTPRAQAQPRPSPGNPPAASTAPAAAAARTPADDSGSSQQRVSISSDSSCDVISNTPTDNRASYADAIQKQKPWNRPKYVERREQRNVRYQEKKANTPVTLTDFPRVWARIKSDANATFSRRKIGVWQTY
jgi:hypothetical protein